MSDPTSKRNLLWEILFPNRIGPMAFLVRLFLVPPCMYLSGFPIRALPEKAPTFDYLLAIWAAVWVLYAVIFIVLPRVVDFGMSPAAAILLLVPVLNVFLFICLAALPRDYWKTMSPAIRRKLGIIRTGSGSGK